MRIKLAKSALFLGTLPRSESFVFDAHAGALTTSRRTWMPAARHSWIARSVRATSHGAYVPGLVSHAFHWIWSRVHLAWTSCIAATVRSWSVSGMPQVRSVTRPGSAAVAGVAEAEKTASRHATAAAKATARRNRRARAAPTRDAIGSGSTSGYANPPFESLGRGRRRDRR